jgi:hypothetical protein
MMPYKLVDYQHFRGMCCLHLQRRYFRNNEREYLKDNELETNRTKILENYLHASINLGKVTQL